MHTITVHDAPAADGSPVTHHFTLPSGWCDEEAPLKPHHLLTISKALCTAAAVRGNAREMDLSEEDVQNGADAIARYELFTDLIQLPHTLAYRLPPADHFYYETDTTDYGTGYAPVERSEYRLLPQLDWCFTPPLFRTSLLPTLEHDGSTWEGPDDHFTYMTLNRWMWGTTLVQGVRAAAKGTEDKALNEVLGALYTPHGVAWNNKLIEAHAARLATLPSATKVAALLNYEAINASLAEDYPRVFDPRGEAYNSPQGVFGMAYDVARSGVLDKHQPIEDVLLHKVLGYMEHALYTDAVNARKAKEAAKT